MSSVIMFAVSVAAVFLGTISVGVQSSPVCPVARGNSCEEVSFYLWTRGNPDEPQQVTGLNISASNYNPTHPTKVVIHGYASGMDLEQLAAIRREYLLRGAYNLIYPQYLSLVDSPCYLTAVINVDYVGMCVARFIRDALAAGRSAPSADPLYYSTTSLAPVEVPGDVVVAVEPERRVLDLHVIGFSLGGQTAAFAANHLKPDLLLKRITGLDPAFPLFMTSDPDRKLSPDDAEFVDVVHTNAFVQGQGARCGHVDFYFNGGVNQPGCRDAGFWSMLKCDHHRAPTYFAESIRSSEGFWGWACNSMEDYDMGRCPAAGCPQLAGDGVQPSARGFYAVQTRSSPPFARGRFWQADGADGRPINDVVTRPTTRRDARTPADAPLGASGTDEDWRGSTGLHGEASSLQASRPPGRNSGDREDNTTAGLAWRNLSTPSPRQPPVLNQGKRAEAGEEEIRK